MKTIVIALGGNALQTSDKPATTESQLEIIKQSVKPLADLIEQGNKLIISHGNGPQIGRIILQNETAKDITPPMNFDVCGAMSQGMIGYHLQQSLGNELKERNIKKPVVSLVTQVIVDKNDPDFSNPSKPVGPFYSKEEADKLIQEKKWIMIEDSGRGYRRVVASPAPLKIVELESIKTLVQTGHIVISTGGGGIPVIEENNKLKGIAAVIDKDLGSEKLAEDLNADLLLILTGVEHISINFNKPNQQDLKQLKLEQAYQYINEEQFAKGSMLPKVKAGIKFVESRKGRQTIIASLNKAQEALQGESGTLITS